MKRWIKVLFEGRLEGVGIESLIDLLTVRAVDLLLKVQGTVLIRLSLLLLLLLLLYHWKETSSTGWIRTVKELNQEGLIVCQVGESSAGKMTGRVARKTCLIETWNAERSRRWIVLEERFHVRLETLDVALHDGQVVGVLLTRLVDAVVSSVGRLI